MKTLTKKAPQSGNRGALNSTHALTQHGQPEHRVVVLGVMYPSGADQQPHKGGRHSSPLLPSEALGNREGMRVIFYDPLSPSEAEGSRSRASIPSMAGIPKPPMRRPPSDSRPADRVKELEAVVRDLALLSLRKSREDR